MATAKKLPSGMYRCLIFDYTDENGKRHYKSFTARTKKEAEYKASIYRMETNKDKECGDTFRVAFEEYIDSRSAILSPTTISSYIVMMNNQLSEFADINIDKISGQDLQDFINRISKKVSPKTVRNIHGLFVSVMRYALPDKAFHTSLPAKKCNRITIPTEKEMLILLNYVKDTDMEIPILLATFAPMRRSEICALNMDHVKGNIIHVEYALVKDKDKQWVMKSPKTTSSDRYIQMPDFVIEKLPKEGMVTSLNPNQITSNFPRILKRCGLPSFRFHDLRHFSASIQHAMGIPDKYIMARGGWATDVVLKNVYQHTMKDKEKEFNEKINSHFSDMQHEMQHKK